MLDRVTRWLVRRLPLAQFKQLTIGSKPPISAPRSTPPSGRPLRRS
jgi:hypothetical protein